MIVRISNEAQYDLPDGEVAALNELDNAAVSVCEAADEAGFARAFADLLEFVRSHGTPLAADSLVESDIILPPADVSLEEASSAFQGEGLIPG